MHTVKLDMKTLPLMPEEGLMLGNGDFSVSVYYQPDRLIWRFGKNDVWDRRQDKQIDPTPMHIDELRRGVSDEGWQFDPETLTTMPTRGDADVERVKEVTQYGPPSYRERPYPCPKPVGELSLDLPCDLHGMEITQTLTIEEGVIDIELTWDEGLSIKLHCLIPPAPNVLLIDWELAGVSEIARTWRSRGVRFSLYRWPDPTAEEFNRKAQLHSLNDMYVKFCARDISPLPAPTVRDLDGLPMLEQTFFPDLEYADGFRYGLLPVGNDARTEDVLTAGNGLAMIRILPRQGATTGSFAVVMGTSGDEGGHEAPLTEAAAELAKDFAGVAEHWRITNAASADEFWGQSSVTCSDAFVEDLWYETLHARRCCYRGDVIAPGLFLPSTLNDFSLWHGDYHTNYNYQSPFWGGYEANQLTLGDSYFPGFAYMIELGRKLAKDYFNAGGTYIQLTGFPFPMDHDPYGVGPFSRMSYMTGWAVNQYWFRWLYTQDAEWLEAEGYPVLRDAAQFYLDFLMEGDDGLVHAFPSDQGEFQFVDDITHYMDRPQVVRHSRYCLRVAAQAGEIVGGDATFIAKCKDYASRLKQADNLEWLGFEGDEEGYFQTPPEFIAWYDDKPEMGDPVEFRLDESNPMWEWYFGHFPLRWSVCMRNGAFEPARHYDAVKQIISRWRRPNGLIRAMSLEGYSYAGAWAESLGIVGPLMEMMLQGGGGVLNVFPLWPVDKDVSFDRLRAEGAFLVSASFAGGSIADGVTIFSEAGAACQLTNPWEGAVSIVDDSGAKVAFDVEGDVVSFATEAEKTYTVRKA
jgi:alpha-L-fucosidase 2